MRTITKWGLIVAVLSALAVLAACGEESGGRDTEVQTVTEERTVTEPAPTPEEPSESQSDSPSEESSAYGGGGDSDGSGKITVPDVEGKDHQLAQDTMQAAGLYNLSEEDATGQGRLLIIDRNWTVVEQDPPAGTKVAEDETITLRSKKDGE